jgi:hypothetical protein
MKSHEKATLGLKSNATVIRRILKKNADFWTEDRSLTALLIYLIIDVFVLLPFRLSRTGEIINAIIFSLILVSGVFAVADKAHLRISLVALALVTFVIHWLHLVSQSPVILIADVVTSMLFMITLALLVVWLIFKEGHVSFHRVQGAIAVYILIGLIWSGAYYLIYIFNPNAFIFPAFQAAEEPFSVRFIYFSYVSLTTLGFGDIIPLSPVAKSLVMVEGLTGQLFPAIMITRLVSLEIESRKNRLL